MWMQTPRPSLRYDWPELFIAVFLWHTHINRSNDIFSRSPLEDYMGSSPTRDVAEEHVMCRYRSSFGAESAISECQHWNIVIMCWGKSLMLMSWGTSNREVTKAIKNCPPILYDTFTAMTQLCCLWPLVAKHNIKLPREGVVSCSICSLLDMCPQNNHRLYQMEEIISAQEGGSDLRGISNMLEKWISRNIIKFNNGKCKIPQLDRNTLIWQWSGDRQVGRQLCRKGPQGPSGKVDHELTMHPCCKGNQQHAGLH